MDQAGCGSWGGSIAPTPITKDAQKCVSTTKLRAGAHDMAAQQMQKMHESTQQSIITELIRAREVGQREGREEGDKINLALSQQISRLLNELHGQCEKTNTLMFDLGCLESIVARKDQVIAKMKTQNIALTKLADSSHALANHNSGVASRYERGLREIAHHSISHIDAVTIAFDAMNAKA